MPPTSPPDVTRLLADVRNGSTEAFDALVPVVYTELRALAHAQRMRHGAADTLNTTALLHEAYLRLAGSSLAWQDRLHFFRTAARAMRQAMVDHARRRRAAKRGGPAPDLSFDEAWMRPLPVGVDLEALDEALARLAALDARQAEVVELRYFIGLTIEETADVLGIAPATVKRDWTVARAWLHDALRA